MTDKQLGENFGWWVGVVVDVKDPHEAGRLKIRVFGKHDDVTNIPDEHLPWANVIQPVTSASIGKIGTAPVGAVKGTQVVGFWADSDYQYPIIIGCIGKSGDIVPGEFEDGAPKIDWAYGSIPSPAQASEPHPYNPYAQVVGRSPLYRIQDIDSGATSIFSVRHDEGTVVTEQVEQGMRHARTPTIAFADPSDTRDVIEISRSVDPLSLGSPFPCLLFNFLSLKDLLALTTSLASAVRNVITQAIRNAILNLAQKYGILKLLQTLNDLAIQVEQIKDLFNLLNIRICGVNIINQRLFDIGNYAFAEVLNGIYSAFGFTMDTIRLATELPIAGINNLFDSVIARPLASLTTSDSPVPGIVAQTPPSDYVRYYYDGISETNPYPGYTRWVHPTTGQETYTRTTEPDYTSPRQHMFFAVEDYFSSLIYSRILSVPNPDPGLLIQSLVDTTVFAQFFSIQSVFGSGFRGSISGASPILAGVVGAALFINFAQNLRPAMRDTALEGTIISDAVDTFVEGQALLARRMRQMTTAISQVSVI